MAGTIGLSLPRTASLTLLALALEATAAVAQSAGATQRHEATPAPTGTSHKHDTDAASDPSHAVHEAMGGAMSANSHMRMSSMRVASAADSARADRIAERARVALAKYKDVRAAERDGYRMFAPNIKNQPVYHFTNLRLAIRERFKFDPAQP